jgi:hypothetical protein
MEVHGSGSFDRSSRDGVMTMKMMMIMIIIKLNFLFSCAASTAKRPITDTAQNIYLRNYHYYYYN